jgi:CubicO group peptidase (beta-lactamase class C family)
MCRIHLSLVSAALAFMAGGSIPGAEPAVDAPAEKAMLTSDKQIESLLEPIREKYKVPGIVAGIVEDDELKMVAAVGVRKFGSPEAITVIDKLHLGSDTKAMTATLLAELVEQKKLSWDSRVGDVFPDVAPQLHADYRSVTLAQLLTHRAGLPANGPWWSLGKGPLVNQRETLLNVVLSRPPVHSPGSRYLYSNVGYVIAGHMAEQVTGQSWEELMAARLFHPLKMSSAGFGSPGPKNKVDQPWGHRVVSGSVEASQADNDPAMGPAGTVHCSLSDWARFVALHLQGARSKGTLLTAETFKVLHTPPSEQDYAFGWIVTERPWAKGSALAHSGSNTMWYATVWIAPARNAAFLAVANHGGDAGREACDASIVALIGFYEKSSGRVPTEGASKN